MYYRPSPVMSESEQLTTGSSSMDDYLEQILLLGEKHGVARPAAISASLAVARASVTNMLQRLDGLGLVVYQRYRHVELTEQGLKIARSIRERHHSLDVLLGMFPLNEKQAHADIEGMEHHISRETLAIFQALGDELAANPKLLKRIHQRWQLKLQQG